MSTRNEPLAIERKVHDQQYMVKTKQPIKKLIKEYLIDELDGRTVDLAKEIGLMMGEFIGERLSQREGGSTPVKYYILNVPKKEEHGTNISVAKNGEKWIKKSIM